MQAGILWVLQCAIPSIALIRTSCICLSFVKPFWAREKIVSRTFFKRLFRARAAILYRQLSREIGRQLPIFFTSPFFGMILILAVRKVLVRDPVARQRFKYLCRGVLKRAQNFFIKQLLSPSIPAALRFPWEADSSSSSIVTSRSSNSRCAALILHPRTKSELQISSPRNSSIHPGAAGTWSAGILYSSAHFLLYLDKCTHFFTVHIYSTV